MKRNKAPKRQTLLQGAAVLLGALAVVKVLGALFKIPLSWILTPVGSAYFGSAYALYFPIYSLAVAGFPAACAACAPCGASACGCSSYWAFWRLAPWSYYLSRMRA